MPLFDISDTPITNEAENAFKSLRIYITMRNDHKPIFGVVNELKSKKEISDPFVLNLCVVNNMSFVDHRSVTSDIIQK